MSQDTPEASVILLDMDQTQLQMVLSDWGEPAFRANQLWTWLYQQAELDPQRMTNLPARLRDRLTDSVLVNPLVPVLQQISKDQLTEKTLFRLPDGALIESVLMHYDRRETVCVSTQVGCAVGCPFCATGQGGFVRDLSPGEIVAQVLHFAHSVAERNLRITNIVLMGMGEPFLNYDATWAAIRRLNAADGFGLRSRAMTISTVGVVSGIRRMSREREQIGLAISLHAPNDELRDALVPMNRRYPLEELLEACWDYTDATNRRLTFEYALMDGVNDSRELARQLADLLSGMLATVNLIPLNPTDTAAYKPSPAGRVREFQEELQSQGVEATVRLRRGLEIKAGCGQLRSDYTST